MAAAKTKEPSVQDLLKLIAERGYRPPMIERVNPELRTTKYAKPSMDALEISAYFVQARD